MAHIHLLIGPVGSGKSTFARKLGNDLPAVRLILDDWMAELYGGDERPADRLRWYVERTGRCLSLIRPLAERLIALDTDVVAELGLVQRAPRQAFYDWADGAGLDLQVYLVDAPRSIRRERVLRRNDERGPTFHTVVPPEIFELASDAWQPPDLAERTERAMRLVWEGRDRGPVPDDWLCE